MRYVRTKDEIYERIMVVRQVCDGKEVAVIRPDKVEFEPILKQADTIEELCDTVIIRGKRYNEEPYYWWFKRHEDKPNLCKIAYDYIKRFEHDDYMQFDEVYGAIWTDKGLIYVAKLNDKGELELL